MLKKNCPHCGGNLKSKGLRDKIILSLSGKLKISRRYYKCLECAKLIYSTSGLKDIGRSQVSKKFAKVSSMMMIFEPFDHAKRLIKEGFNINVSETCLRDIAHRIGVKLYKDAEKNGRMPYDLYKAKEEIDLLYLIRNNWSTVAS